MRVKNESRDQYENVPQNADLLSGALHLVPRPIPENACVSATPIEDCAKLMEDNQIRRVPVVNGGGMVCGIVSQADIAKNASRKITADLVKDVSQPARV